VQPAAPVAPFEHPDALRRFRVMANVEELERALAFPWDRWTVFLHPDQRELVERGWQGPARVSGSAGTGKTIVALHRAAHLARRHPGARVLLTTFSDTLAHALRTQLRWLLGSEPRLAERVDVYSLDALGLRLHTAHLGAPAVGGRDVVTTLMREAAGAVAERLAEGVLPHELGVFVRSVAQFDRARAAVRHANSRFAVLDDHVETRSGHVWIATMHLAKGLEFRAVAVMACDDDVVPLQARIETVGDDGDLQEVYETERHLLYVACTRARDHLLVTSIEPGSEFLDDLRDAGILIVARDRGL
jgi:superfamily I DNA/RNA helicase